MVYLVLIVSFFLDGILSNFLPFMIQDVSFFIPFFTLVALFFSSSFFKKERKHYAILSFVVGFLYDLFYTNLLFTNAILFLALSFFFYWLQEKVAPNALTYGLCLILSIGIYHFSFAFLLFFFNIVPVNSKEVLHVFLSSLFLNVLYGELLFFLFQISHRKRRLN